MAVARFFSFFLLLLVLSTETRPAAAFKLVPFSATFAPVGPDASQTFRIDNDWDQPIAVQVTMVHREMGSDGKETLSDAEDDFVVFPSQLVLLPNEGRTVRVQWLGDAAPKSELAYRLIAEQLPVDLDQKTNPHTNVRILVRYEATAYITPPSAKPDISIESAGPTPVPSGPPMLTITVRNDGTAHALLHPLSITLRSKASGTTLTLSDEQLAGVHKENVLAGHTRRFTLPWPDGFPVGDIEATIKVAGGQ